MIPVPESELELYDLENESDDTYKDLVQNEMIFIRKNREKIDSNAKLLYKQKIANDTTAGYAKSALDYQAFELTNLVFDCIGNIDMDDSDGSFFVAIYYFFSV